MNKNIKVNINTDEINKGEEIILTLADRYIIKDNDINDDIDELENYAIKENDKLELKKKAQEKMKVNNLK